MRAYQKTLPEIHALVASLVAVSPQTPDHTLLTVEQNELEFEVLTDAGNKVARHFGLVFPLNESLRSVYHHFGIDLPAFNGDDSYELPVPGTFVIAPDGTILLAFVDADYTRRLEPAEILDALQDFLLQEK